jgi:hypothetical protein
VVRSSHFTGQRGVVVSERRCRTNLSTGCEAVRCSAIEAAALSQLAGVVAGLKVNAAAADFQHSSLFAGGQEGIESSQTSGYLPSVLLVPRITPYRVYSY